MYGDQSRALASDWIRAGTTPRAREAAGLILVLSLGCGTILACAGSSSSGTG